MFYWVHMMNMEGQMEFNPDFPCAVDVPMPHFGNQDRILLILEAAKACIGGAMVTTHGEPDTAEVRQWFNRISTRSAEDADLMVRLLRRFDARRIR
jgi:hypothetical protein